MKRVNKVLTVLLVLALVLTPVLKEFSVQAEEGDSVVQEETLAEEETPEVEEPEVQEPEAENPEAEDPEGEFEFIPDEEVMPEEEITDPEIQEEEETQDQVTPEGETTGEETPDPETPGEEESQEEETPGEAPKETPEETPEETEDTVTPEGTPDGVHFAFEEMTEVDLEALPLSALLGYLRDGDGNALTLPEGADTLWFRIQDGNGNVVYNESYGAGFDAVLNLRQYFVTPGYTLELTAGTGEREQTGNTVYQVEMGSEEYQTNPLSLLDYDEVNATCTLDGLRTVFKWREIFENIYDRDTGEKLEIPSDSVVMWRTWEHADGHFDPDSYVQANPDEEVDLQGTNRLELLVGTGNQWDENSTMLNVFIDKVYPESRTYHLGQETDSGWVNMTSQSQDVVSIEEEWFDYPYYECYGDLVTFVSGDLKSGDTYYAGIDIPESDLNSPFWDITVYDMNDAEASDDLSLQIDVTSQIVNQPMDTPGAGYPCKYRSGRENVFAVVFTSKETGEIIDVNSVRYEISPEDYKISGTLLTEDGEQVGETKDILDSFSGAIYHPRWYVPYSDWISRKYYLKLDIQSSQEKPFLGIVEGPCSSWDDAYAKLEAGGDLLPALKEGYTTEALKGAEGAVFDIVLDNHKWERFNAKVFLTAYHKFSGMLYDEQGQEALQSTFTISPSIAREEGVLKPGHYLDDPLFLRLTLEEGDDIGAIQKIVEGSFDDAEDLAELEDAMPQLLGTDGSSVGYPIHYSGSPIHFTLLYQDGSVTQMAFNIKEITPTLYLYGLKQDGRSLTSYEVQSEYQGSVSDTQYQYNYYTIFLYDEDADLSRLTLDYAIYPEGSRLTANGVAVDSNTIIDFSKGPVHFTVTYEGWARTNYTVFVVQRSAQPQLFVYPSDTPAIDPETGVVPEEDYVREIFLDENNEYRHDILIANLGDAPLTGIKVSLTGADGDSANMCCSIDDYWNVDGGTLAPFTHPDKYAETLPNISKISLIPDQNGGPINGTLTISADGVEPVKIKLIGFARDPRILNEGSLLPGVKYVPYSTIIDTNCQYDWIQTTFTVSGLPEGLEWRERTGEIYGIPQAAGEYTVTITANFTATGGSGYQFNPCTVELTLTIEDNTDENVFTATDSGYELEQPIGTQTIPYHFVLTELQNELFVSRGELSELIDVWLNGQKLVRDAEYGAESGSSRITVWKQTLDNKADRSGGKNTLAAEFREGGNEDNPLHRTAQNFYVETEETQPTPTEPGSEPTTGPSVPTQGPPAPTVGPQPTTPAEPTTGPQPTATAAPTSAPRPTPTTAPTNAPLPTATATPTNAPRPTATQAPDLTEAPVPSDAPKPSEVPNPSKEPKPTKQPNPTRVPQASGTPGPDGAPGGGLQPGGGPVPSGTPGPDGAPGGGLHPSGGAAPSVTPGTGENPGASGTPAPAVSMTPLPTATPVEINYVNLAASLTDGDGNPLVTRNLEMHSDPVASTTDVNGLAGFGRVEYGTHTVYLKDENGNLGPSTTFTLEPGDNFSMEAGKITGKRGSAMTINLTFVDGKLILNGVEEGIKSKPAPQTGDESMPGVWLLLMAISVFAGMIILRKGEK